MSSMVGQKVNSSILLAENDFIDTAGVISKGYRYNNHWGNLNGGIQMKE